MKKIEDNKLKISAIKNGTVIDHIDADRTLDVVKILDLKEEQIMIGVNFDSKKIKKKGVIKISGKELNSKELNKIAFVSQNATIIIIKDYEVKKKEKVSVPKEFIGIAKCGNINCITNHEELNTHFHTVKKEPIIVCCDYCEKMFDNKLELL